MKTIWVRTHKKKNLTRNIKRILLKWKVALKEYQEITGELGYGWYYTEKSNFGFFLWACARLGMYFLPEFTTTRMKRGERQTLGHPDCWIYMDKQNEAYFEVKRDFGCIDTGPRRTIFRKIKSAERQLKSLRDLERSSHRIALCFVVLWRNMRKSEKSWRRAFSNYLSILQSHKEIDFYGAYLSPDKIIKEDFKASGDTVSYPAILVIGRLI